MGKVEAYIHALFTGAPTDRDFHLRMHRRWPRGFVYLDPWPCPPTHFPAIPVSVLVAFSDRNPGVIEGAPQPYARHSQRVLPLMAAYRAERAFASVLKTRP